MINVMRVSMFLACGIFILSMVYMFVGFCLPLLGYPKMANPIDAVVPAMLSGLFVRLIYGPYEQAEVAADIAAAKADALVAASEAAAVPVAESAEIAPVQTVVSTGSVTAPTPVSSVGRKNKRTRHQKSGGKPATTLVAEAAPHAEPSATDFVATPDPQVS